MISSIKSRLWVTALLLASLCCCLAGQAAPAPVNLSFTGSTAPVYDLTGEYRFDQQLLIAGVPSRLTLSLTVRQDAAGRLLGSGSTIIYLGQDAYAATYGVSGRISGGGKSTRATLVARLQGADLDAGGKPPFVISVQYNLEVKPAGLKGTVRGSGRFAALGNGSIKSLISGVPLPPGVDGSWSVQMNVLPVNKVNGTGAILLPNGRNLPATLAGNAMTSGLSQVKLSGTNGATLNINFFPQTRAVQKLSGRILGQTVAGAPAPAQYIGWQACIECHGPIYQTVIATPHAQLGVQCEGCHGPAAQHAANYYDPLVRPIVDLGGAACGTCHSGPQHPTYEEWSASDHATLFGDLNLTNRINDCAQCHSGSVRVSLLDGVPLPAAGANVPIGCPTCHSMHQATPFPAQLRNPMFSTNDYSFVPSTNFASVYNPNINLCGQCHNKRGASWTNSAAAPHQSPQYNFLLGNIGELPGGSATFNPGSHAGLPESAQYSFSGSFYLTNQCVSCHMQNDSAQVPNHTFTVQTYDACLNCHAVDPALLVQLVAVPAVSNRVWRLKFALDLWAGTKAPAGLQTNGVLAWEYTTPGGLIWQTNNGVVGWTVVSQVNFRGPDALGQELLPDPIRKARFNMYLVLRDGSFGVHNPYFAVDLLETAQAWVAQELNK